MALLFREGIWHNITVKALSYMCIPEATMRKFLAVAGLILIGTSAQAAEHYSFQIGGRTVRIEVPNRCADISCISVNVPGVDLGKLGGSSNEDVPPLPKLPSEQQSTTPAPAATAPAATTPPATTNAPSTSTSITPPAPPPVANTAPAGTGGLAPAPAVQPAPAAPAVASTTPAPAATPSHPAILPGTLMPVGVWATEKNEGKVRIVQCGSALCGYAVDEKTNANGKQVLIDMKSTRENLWNGKINDVKNGGIYVSKMSLHGPDALRVEGCAMGGMLCGGQTWSRVQ
jgi:uncharacterized protein (DUF2147 family)